MVRLLTAGTAALALLATGALAQSASPTDASMAAPSAISSMMDMATSAASSMAASSMAASSMEPSMMSSVQPFSITSGYAVLDTDQLATRVIGTHVFDGTQSNANDLGKINDLVINKDGTIAAVVLGVGGFLGIGEKQVAVDFRSLQWTTATDNTRRFVLQTTKDQLTQAPDFKTVDNTAASGASASAPASAAKGATVNPAMNPAVASSSSAQ